jgi:hypothetical protein
MFKIFQRNNVGAQTSCLKSPTISLLKINKKFIYYDNLEVDRNLDFVLNLGYNSIPSKINSEIKIRNLLSLMFKRRLISTIKKRYKNLLYSIEQGDLEIMDNSLEDNIRYVLFRDLKTMYEKSYSIQVVNKKDPIYVKILNVYELENVNVDRRTNGEITEKDLMYMGKSKIILSKYDPSVELAKDGKSYGEIQREREEFEKSGFRQAALDKLKETVRQDYNFQYAKEKIGVDKSDRNIEYISNLIAHLENSEKQEDLYSQQVKIQFSDYYKNRSNFINEKLKSPDLFNFFRTNMKSEYRSFLIFHEARQGILKKFLSSIRKRFIKRYAPKSQRITKEKTLYVIDVEISSRMRLEIKDENSKNVLDSIYNYKNRIKRQLNLIKNNVEYLNYDTGVYKFSLPDKRWDYNHEEFHQTHVIRFEYEKTNTLRTIFRKPYDTLKITDIDLCLKGNKHFKFSKNFL